jgi:FKBP-type peptidyl-prolyl cis-trans isomerase FkpA
MNKLYLFLLVLIGSFSQGCSKLSENDNQCSFDACAVKAPNAEIQAVQQYLSANNITAVEHCSGLFYKVETPGTGKTPNTCSYIEAQFKGMLANGTIFQETQAGDNLKAYLSGSIIRGWKIGVPLLKAGGKITLYIPPTLGFGATDVKDNNNNVVIPANSITIFEIQLVAVQ